MYMMVHDFWDEKDAHRTHYHATYVYTHNHTWWCMALVTRKTWIARIIKQLVNLYVSSYVCVNLYTRVFPICAHKHILAWARAHTHTRIHAHTHTHTTTHTHMHMHSHTHTHSCMLNLTHTHQWAHAPCVNDTRRTHVHIDIDTDNTHTHTSGTYTFIHTHSIYQMQTCVDPINQVQSNYRGRFLKRNQSFLVSSCKKLQIFTFWLKGHICPICR